MHGIKIPQQVCAKNAGRLMCEGGVLAGHYSSHMSLTQCVTGVRDQKVWQGMRPTHHSRGMSPGRS